MIQIPSKNQWVSSGQSDVLGSLWSSFNLNLTDKPGKTLVSPRTIITTNDITDLGIPVAFKTFTDVNAGIQYCWCVAGKYLFNMNLATAGYITAFAKVTTSGAPTSGTNTECSSDLSDMVNVGKLFLVVSTRTRMDFLTASTGAWVNVQYDTGGTPTAVTLTDACVHMLEIYAGRLYVTDNNTQVRSVTATAAGLASSSASNTLTTSGSNFLDLATNGDPITSISFIKRHANGIWVGTVNQAENGAFIYDYDGDVTNSRYIIPDASAILAGAVKNNTIWVIDNNGRLLFNNGGAFVEPHTQGMASGRLPIKNQKYLKNPLSALNDRFIHPNGFQFGSNGKLQAFINNEYNDNGTTIEENLASGLWEYDPNIGWYHKLSVSLYTASITDYGQNRVSRVGAIYPFKDDSNASTANGTMLLGAQVYTDSSTTAENIYTDDSNDTLQKFGYFVTPKIYSTDIQDSWESLTARFKKFLNSTDKIIIKVRFDDPVSVEYTGTWTSTTTFTVTGDLSSYVGYEVEVLQGKGSGKCSHISSVSYSAPTSTVTVDETYTGCTSGTFKFRVQNWIKKGSYNAQTVKYYKVGIGTPETWVQIKVCLQFTGANELDDLFLINNKQ